MVAPFPRDVEPEPTVPRSISGPFGMRHGGVARGHFWTATFKLGHYQTEENALQKMGMSRGGIGIATRRRRIGRTALRLRKALAQAPPDHRSVPKFATAGEANPEELDLYARVAANLRRLMEAVGWPSCSPSSSRRTRGHSTAFSALPPAVLSQSRATFTTCSTQGAGWRWFFGANEPSEYPLSISAKTPIILNIARPAGVDVSRPC
jgi:hypothetical protein